MKQVDSAVPGGKLSVRGKAAVVVLMLAPFYIYFASGPVTRFGDEVAIRVQYGRETVQAQEIHMVNSKQGMLSNGDELDSLSELVRGAIGATLLGWIVLLWGWLARPWTRASSAHYENE